MTPRTSTTPERSSPRDGDGFVSVPLKAASASSRCWVKCSVFAPEMTVDGPQV